MLYVILVTTNYDTHVLGTRDGGVYTDKFQATYDCSLLSGLNPLLKFVIRDIHSSINFIPDVKP